MANCCFFEMRVLVLEADADRIDALIHPQGGEGGLLASFMCDEPTRSLKPDANGRVMLTYYGECKWSVHASLTRNSSMCYPSRIPDSVSLEDIAAEPNVDVEVYAEESGFNFEEHVLYLDGVLETEESADYFLAEFEEGEYPSPKEFCEDLGFDIDPDGFVLDEGTWIYRSGGLEKNWTIGNA